MSHFFANFNKKTYNNEVLYYKKIMIHNIEKQSNIENPNQDIDNLQSEVVNNQLNSLENKVENINNNSDFLEIIKETSLYNKLQETFKDNTIYPDLNWNIDAKINRFSESINNTVINYLDWILSTPEKQFSKKATQSMSTSIQFLLMETLNEQSNNKNWKFFESFWNINFEWINSILSWLTSSFGKSTWFLNLWKKITRTIDIISFNISKIKNPETTPDIMNPYKFMNIIKNINLDTTKEIALVSLKDIWIIQLEWEIKMDENEKNYLKQIAENSKLKNDPETIKWIIKSLNSASKLIEKRSDLSQKAIEMMDKADWLLWPLQNMLWIDIIDIIKPFKWVLNIFLSFLWFSLWIDWLERKWLRTKIDKEFSIWDRTEFISYILNDFSNQPNKSIKNSILTKFWSSIPRIEEQKSMKIDLDYDNLYQSMLKDRENKDWKIINFFEILNPLVLKNMWWEYNSYLKETKNSKWNIEYTIDPSFELQKEKFVEKYIQYILPNIVKNKDFLDKINTPKEFLLSITWSLFIETKYITDWIKAKSISPEMFIEDNPNIDTDISSENESNVEININEDKLINAIKESIIPHESAWNYWAVNKDDVWTWVSISLFQRHWERARKLCNSLYERNKTDFKNIMWEKIIKDLNKTNQRASSENSNKNKIIWTDSDSNNFKTLMEKQEFKDIVDNLIKQDCIKYIQEAKNQWITDPKSIIYYSNIINKYWINWAKKYVWNGDIDSMYALVWKRENIKNDNYEKLYNTENIA